MAQHHPLPKPTRVCNTALNPDGQEWLFYIRCSGHHRVCRGNEERSGWVTISVDAVRSRAHIRNKRFDLLSRTNPLHHPPTGLALPPRSQERPRLCQDPRTAGFVHTATDHPAVWSRWAMQIGCMECGRVGYLQGKVSSTDPSRGSQRKQCPKRALDTCNTSCPSRLASLTTRAMPGTTNDPVIPAEAIMDPGNRLTDRNT